MELVSIGMSVYNCSSYINDSIKSIINQTYSNWELIIVNDNSTDDTLEKISNYKDTRIKLINNDTNKGLPYGLNLCIKLSSGKYFARMDGDDIMVEDRLEKQVKFLETNPQIDVVGSFAYVIDSSRNILGLRNVVPPKNLKELISTQGYFIHPSVVGKREWFLTNLYDEEIRRCQDFELWLRTYSFSNFYILKEHLLFYRELGESSRWKYYQVFKNIKIILQKHRTKISFFQYILSLSKAYIKYLFYSILKLLGLLQAKYKIDSEKKEEIQVKLNKVISL